jgi:hypothetical protein
MIGGRPAPAPRLRSWALARPRRRGGLRRPHRPEGPAGTTRTGHRARPLLAPRARAGLVVRAAQESADRYGLLPVAAPRRRPALVRPGRARGGGPGRAPPPQARTRWPRAWPGARRGERWPSGSARDPYADPGPLGGPGPTPRPASPGGPSPGGAQQGADSRAPAGPRPVSPERRPRRWAPSLPPTRAPAPGSPPPTVAGLGAHPPAPPAAGRHRRPDGATYPDGWVDLPTSAAGRRRWPWSGHPQWRPAGRPRRCRGHRPPTPGLQQWWPPTCWWLQLLVLPPRLRRTSATTWSARGWTALLVGRRRVVLVRVRGRRRGRARRLVLADGRRDQPSAST